MMLYVKVLNNKLHYIVPTKEGGKVFVYIFEGYYRYLRLGTKKCSSTLVINKNDPERKRE